MTLAEAAIAWVRLDDERRCAKVEARGRHRIASAVCKDKTQTGGGLEIDDFWRWSLCYESPGTETCSHLCDNAKKAYEKYQRLAHEAGAALARVRRMAREEDKR